MKMISIIFLLVTSSAFGSESVSLDQGNYCGVPTYNYKGCTTVESGTQSCEEDLNAAEKRLVDAGFTILKKTECEMQGLGCGGGPVDFLVTGSLTFTK